MKATLHPVEEQELTIKVGEANLQGDLNVPAGASGLVIFAHGSGSGRKSSRNRFVAKVLNQHGLGTLLFDLLTQEEERMDAYTAHLRFDVRLLARRLCLVTEWFIGERGEVPIAYFGASTGAAAALIAAADLGPQIDAVVSRGGRPDLAGLALRRVVAPTLLLIGSEDQPVIRLNAQAYANLACEKRMEIIPGATHLFEEAGTLERVSELAAEWFQHHLASARAPQVHS